MKLANLDQRRALQGAGRIIIKVGTRVLVDDNGNPDPVRIRHLVKEIAALHHAGKEVVLVSSGAIAAGVQTLGLQSRPTQLPQLQMAAAVGQVRLMTLYDTFFSDAGCRIGQVLLTYDDLRNRPRHLNARNTILELLRQNLIPVVNENDVVSVDEIKFGDNDILASMVAILIEAETLILLTTSDGLQTAFGTDNARRIPYLKSVTKRVLAHAMGKDHMLSMGGMESKLKSAQAAIHAGARVVIADGRKKNILTRILNGADTGTLIGGSLEDSRSLKAARKRWIAFFHKQKGTLVIDEGARIALEENGNSLLPVGITTIEGHFEKGSLVNIKSADGRLVARGLVDYSSDRLAKIKGHPTSEIKSILGFKDYDEVIHRDNMVVLKRTEEESI